MTQTANKWRGERNLAAALTAAATITISGQGQTPPESEGFVQGDRWLSRRHPPDVMASRLKLEVVPLVDLYQFVRACAAPRSTIEPPPGFEAAVSACETIQQKFGRNFLAWGVLDGALVGCDSAAQLRSRFDALPETMQLPDDPEVPIRDDALRFADALIDLEPVFEKEMWPIHRARIQVTAELLERELLPTQDACLRYMMEALDINDPHAEIPVYLVHTAPWPGAMTFRRGDGIPGGVCFVAVEKFESTQLHETILHEATHALDVLTMEQDHVLNELQRRVAEKRQTPHFDRYNFDVPHAVMFVQAGETVRRLLDTEHVHYGVTAGVYERLPLAAEVIVPVWRQHLDGVLTRQEALDRIVEAVPMPLEE